MGHRTLIVSGKRQAGKLGEMLRGEGYKEVETAYDCASAMEKNRVFQPEVALIESALLPCEDPLSVISKIIEERPLAIVMLSSYDQIDMVLEADGLGVSAHLFRPMTKENLLGAIKLGLSRFRQCQLLHSELGNCKEALRVRKLVERAKGILMKRNSLTEEQAFLALQKLSRDNNLKMEQVADSIITADKIMV